MIVADVSFADIFWSLLWFYFLFLWIMSCSTSWVTCSATTRCRG